MTAEQAGTISESLWREAETFRTKRPTPMAIQSLHRTDLWWRGDIHHYHDLCILQSIHFESAKPSWVESKRYHLLVNIILKPGKDRPPLPAANELDHRWLGRSQCFECFRNIAL